MALSTMHQGTKAIFQRMTPSGVGQDKIYRVPQEFKRLRVLFLLCFWDLHLLVFERTSQAKRHLRVSSAEREAPWGEGLGQKLAVPVSGMRRVDGTQHQRPSFAREHFLSQYEGERSPYGMLSVTGQALV